MVILMMHSFGHETQLQALVNVISKTAQLSKESIDAPMLVCISKHILSLAAEAHGTIQDAASTADSSAS